MFVCFPILFAAQFKIIVCAITWCRFRCGHRILRFTELSSNGLKRGLDGTILHPGIANVIETAVSGRVSMSVSL